MKPELRTELATRIAAATTFHPAWIDQQLRLFDAELYRAVTSHRYATVVANAAKRGPLTRLEADGDVFLVLYTPRMRGARNRLTSGQLDTLATILNALIRADVVARQEVTV